MSEMSNSKIPIGARIGMSFNEGVLKHDIYGDAGEVCGVVPLLLPYGSYKFPSILSDPERLNKLVNKMVPEYRGIWEDDLDSEVATKVKDFILFAASTHPLEEVETDRMQTYISFVILIFAIDDLCDQLSEGSSKALKYSDIKKMVQFLLDVFEGAYSCLEDMPSPIKGIESTNAYIWKSIALCEQHIPDFVGRNKYVKQEWVNCLTSFVLFTEKPEDGPGFSKGSRALFGAYQAALTGHLEMTALLQNATVSKQVRKDILFRRMKEAAGALSNMMNDIFGLERDMKLYQVKDSLILGKVMEDGVALRVAWKTTVKNICAESNDVRMCMKYLREIRGDDQGLMEYIRCLERMLDGQMYWYQNTDRYRNANLNVVQIFE